MVKSGQSGVSEIFTALGARAPAMVAGGLMVYSPTDGAILAQLAQDSPSGVSNKAMRAREAQQKWAQLPRAARAALLEALAASIKEHRDLFAGLITLEGGKTAKEALIETDSAADTLLKTIKDAALPEFSGMLRRKERPAIGVVGLITSFNFPLVVANWTLAPALLAGNGVLWKSSEKTPLTALAYKILFDKVAGEYSELLHILIGGRDIGGALVAHEGVDLISATGSVGMGQGIKATLAEKQNNAFKPILELGGNNGVIISEKMTPAHLEWAVQSILTSFLATSGQRCTNTRRLIVHKKHYDKVVTLLQKHIEDFVASGVIKIPLSGESNDYGYGPLIDADSFKRFERAKTQVVAQGGKVLLGKRLLEKEWPSSYYVEPALGILFSQTAIMHEETFAPILFMAPYEGDIDAAIAMVNAPANAGLVNALYTQNQAEADHFAAKNLAGHSIINSPKGTGTPAFGMGFGGNKESGEGEILNSADPLHVFTRDTHYTRIAQNKDVVMDQ